MELEHGFRAPITSARVTSRDGTKIAAYRIGRGRTAWIMPPAMGAPLIAMRQVIEPLASRCAIYTWDMRGFHGSDPPRDPDAYGVADHLEDMRAVMEAFGAPSEYVLGGWSMGVQLSLEAALQSPRSVRALLLIAGPYGRALEKVFPLGHGAIARALDRGAYRAGPAITRAARALLAPRSRLPAVAERLGLLRRSAEIDEVIARFREIDWGRYLTVIRHLHAHDVEPRLSEIHAPALVTCGTRDLFTPMRTARRLHALLAGSELFVVPGATHYVVLEHGALLAARIERFLDAVDRIPRAH